MVDFPTNCIMQVQINSHTHTRPHLKPTQTASCLWVADWIKDLNTPISDATQDWTQDWFNYFKFISFMLKLAFYIRNLQLINIYFI